VSIYVQVRDLRETLDRAVGLGATVTAEPFQLEGQPTLAFITDPEGNPVGLVQQ
jgi:predicted enzyme related to lactoylglutathione lyase